MKNGKTRAESIFVSGPSQSYGEFYNSVYKKELFGMPSLFWALCG